MVEHFDLLAIDLRGRGIEGFSFSISLKNFVSGNSSKPMTASAYGYAQHARDVAQVFEYHKLQAAHVMGHSMGAFVSEQFAHE